MPDFIQVTISCYDLSFFSFQPFVHVGKKGVLAWCVRASFPCKFLLTSFSCSCEGQTSLL